MDPFCYQCFMFVFVILSCLFLAALWSFTWKGLTSWLSCTSCLLAFLSLSYMVSWVRCGTVLYRFPIFAFFLTFCLNRARLHLCPGACVYVDVLMERAFND